MNDPLGSDGQGCNITRCTRKRRVVRNRTAARVGKFAFPSTANASPQVVVGARPVELRFPVAIHSANRGERHPLNRFAASRDEGCRPFPVDLRHADQHGRGVKVFLYRLTGASDRRPQVFEHASTVNHRSAFALHRRPSNAIRRWPSLMALTGELFVGNQSQLSEPRDRLSAYLRRQFQREGFAAKRLANAIRCTPKTAENILDGHWPTSRHLQRIVQIFGYDMLDAVFGPDIDETINRLRREEAELEQLLQQKRALRLQAEGVGHSDARRLEASAGEHDTVERRSFAPRRGRP